MRRDLIAAVLGLALVALVPPAAPRRGALRTGLSDAEAFRLGEQLAFERIRGAGARFVRLTLHWRLVAPANEPLLWDPSQPGDPNYDWSSGSTSQVRMAPRAGLSRSSSSTAPRAGPRRCEREQQLERSLRPRPGGRSAEFAQRRGAPLLGQFLGLPRVRFWHAGQRAQPLPLLQRRSSATASRSPPPSTAACSTPSPRRQLRARRT